MCKVQIAVESFYFFNKLIYQYDPPIRNHNNKVLYCMMKGDHLYTQNHNIDILTQQFAKHRPDDDEYDDKDVVVIKPSSNYRVEEDRDPNHYTMIHHIDDLLN